MSPPHHGRLPAALLKKIRCLNTMITKSRPKRRDLKKAGLETRFSWSRHLSHGRYPGMPSRRNMAETADSHFLPTRGPGPPESPGPSPPLPRPPPPENAPTPHPGGATPPPRSNGVTGHPRSAGDQSSLPEPSGIPGRPATMTTASSPVGRSTAPALPAPAHLPVTNPCCFHMCVGFS